MTLTSLFAAVAALAVLLWLLRPSPGPAPGQKAAAPTGISARPGVDAAAEESAGAAASGTPAGAGEPSPAPPLPADPGPARAEARQQADSLFSAGRYPEALVEYLRLLPDDPLCRVRVGVCLAKLDRWGEAFPELQAAVEAQPGDFTARKWLALAFYRRNELEPALEQARAALALMPDGELRDLRDQWEKETRVQRNYDDARTGQFVVLFDGREHEEIKVTVLDLLKSAYTDIGKELDYFPSQPVSVILYTAKDFSDVTRAPEWAGGMYGKLDGKIRLPVQGASGHEAALRRVLYHEYTHAMLFSLAPACPMWLQEGLAQYLSGDEPANLNQIIPLAMLSGGFPRESLAAIVAYLESLQVVCDLVEEHGLAQLRRLLEELGEGTSLESAFAAVYGKPFSRWAAEWRPSQPGD